MLARIRCAWRGVHRNAKRHPVGGFSCPDCLAVGESLDDMGYLGNGYVSPVRRLYSRDNGGTLTRTGAWTETRRGW